MVFYELGYHAGESVEKKCAKCHFIFKIGKHLANRTKYCKSCSPSRNKLSARNFKTDIVRVKERHYQRKTNKVYNRPT